MSTACWRATGKERLNRQHVQRALQLAPGVLIAGAGRGLNPLLIHRAGVLHAAQLLQRLAAMKVCGRIIRIIVQQIPEFHDGFFQLSIDDVFHGQAVARETIARILRQHILENFHSIGRHISTCYYTERWPARTFTRWPGSRRAAGWCRRGCLWEIPTRASAAPRTHRFSPTKRGSVKSAISATAAPVVTASPNWLPATPSASILHRMRAR